MSLSPFEFHCDPCHVRLEARNCLVVEERFHHGFTNEPFAEERVAVWTTKREISRLGQLAVPFLDRPQLDPRAAACVAEPPLNERQDLRVESIDRVASRPLEHVADLVPATARLLCVENVREAMAAPAVHLDERDTQSRAQARAEVDAATEQQRGELANAVPATAESDGCDLYIFRLEAEDRQVAGGWCRTFPAVKPTSTDAVGGIAVLPELRGQVVLAAPLHLEGDPRTVACGEYIGAPTFPGDLCASLPSSRATSGQDFRLQPQVLEGLAGACAALGAAMDEVARAELRNAWERRRVAARERDDRPFRLHFRAQAFPLGIVEKGRDQIAPRREGAQRHGRRRMRFASDGASLLEKHRGFARLKRMGYVYILQSGSENLFKVGKTSGELAARIKQLATGNPHPLTLFDSIETDDYAACETFLHGRLQSKRCTNGSAREFFELPPDELHAAIQDARDYLADDLPREKEAEKLTHEQDDGRIVQPSSADWDVYMNLLRAREEEQLALTRKTRFETRLKLVLGAASGLDGMATWKTQTAMRFDLDSFKTAEPELHERYLRESKSRPFFLRAPDTPD